MQNSHAHRHTLILSSEIGNQRRFSSAFPTEYIHMQVMRKYNANPDGFAAFFM